MNTHSFFDISQKVQITLPLLKIRLCSTSLLNFMIGMIVPENLVPANYGKNPAVIVPENLVPTNYGNNPGVIVPENLVPTNYGNNPAVIVPENLVPTNYGNNPGVIVPEKYGLFKLRLQSVHEAQTFRFTRESVLMKDTIMSFNIAKYTKSRPKP
jgi:hypothetical protein